MLPILYQPDVRLPDH